MAAAAAARLDRRIMSTRLNSALAGITVDQARAHVVALNLLLASRDLDEDTERRARWLKMRLCEILPETEHQADFIDARIAFVLEGRRPAIAA